MNFPQRDFNSILAGFRESIQARRLVKTLGLPVEAVELLLIDPVMAARVLMGWELDDFAAAALRMDWWFPETVDDSATNTGKTVRVFILANLRALLIPGTPKAPGHWVGIYFQNFTVGKDEFWPYFKMTIEKSDFFADQLLPGHGKLGETLAPGAWRMDFKCGGRILMPAPGHGTDGSSHASRRFNTLIVDEWRICEEKGDAMAKQLLSRVTRDSFNQHHPIWGNHIHRKGHAEPPSHKSQGLVNRFKRQIKDGSTRHAIYSFCYRDVSKKVDQEGKSWRKILVQTQMIRTMRAQLPEHERAGQLLGVSRRAGANFYPEAVLHECRVWWVEPQLRRLRDVEVFILGQDLAPGATAKADSSASSVIRLREVRNGRGQMANGRLRGPMPDGRERPMPNVQILTPNARGVWETMEPVATFRHPEFGDWEVAYVFDSVLKNVGSDETAGYIHRLDQRFTFSSIVLDMGAGGGGPWIYKDLRKAAQVWDGKTFTVIPVCHVGEAASGDKRAIVHYFKRGEEFDELSDVVKANLVSDDGFLAQWHDRFQGAWHAREVVCPIALEDRGMAEGRRMKDEGPAWEPEKIEANRVLDLGLLQLTRINKLIRTGDGGAQMSRKGFPLFRATGKKDIAMAKLMAFAGALHYIETQGGKREAEEECYFVPL